MQGKRPRERPRIGMLNELKEGSYGQMKRRAEDREGWICWIHETCHLTEHYRRELKIERDGDVGFMRPVI